MSDTPDHEATQTAAHMPNVRGGYATDPQMAEARNKSERQQRAERQRGEGPP